MSTEKVKLVDVTVLKEFSTSEKRQGKVPSIIHKVGSGLKVNEVQAQTWLRRSWVELGKPVAKKKAS